MKNIEIDLDVNRSIENGRLAFEETANQILRRLLGIDPKSRPQRSGPALRSPRSSGAYSAVIGDTAIEANSLKELLKRALLAGERLSPGLIEQLAQLPTPKGRYIVARTPAGLYPKSPQLVDYAEPLSGPWWFDTNVGRSQVQSCLRRLAEVLALPQVPNIGKRSEKSTLSLADLGLE